MNFGSLCKARYIIHSSKVIVDALKSGCDVVQFGNGDIITTEIRVKSKEYKWSDKKQQLVSQ